jgi:3-(3-hydroxy-phenyl)propionate hydroxylase
VSPFGARGANGGIQDADNLGWKLALVLDGAPDSLLDSYDMERMQAADENILNSTRSTEFITPKSGQSRIFRDAVLDLAGSYPMGRPLVNSGRLSVPCTHDGSELASPDALDGPARTRPGSPCPDAPLGEGFLLDRLGGGFTLLAIDAEAPESVTEGGVTARRLAVSVKDDPSGALRARYLGDAPSALYLIRPDQHVAMRRPGHDDRQVRAAIRRATGRA